MGLKEREIGKRAEREAAEKLNELLGTNFRRSQQHKGAADSADIIDDDVPDLHVEVKRRKSMNLHEVVEIARAEASSIATSVVIHKRPRERWLLTVDLEDLPHLAKVVIDILQYTGREIGESVPSNSEA